mgnify:CR=1 FL=1
MIRVASTPRLRDVPQLSLARPSGGSGWKSGSRVSVLSAVLLPPAKVSLLRDLQLFADFGRLLPLAKQHVGTTQLCENLIYRVSFLFHPREYFSGSMSVKILSLSLYPF